MAGPRPPLALDVLDPELELDEGFAADVVKATAPIARVRVGLDESCFSEDAEVFADPWLGLPEPAGEVRDGARLVGEFPDEREAELERLEAEQRKLNEALDRYFRAFEEGTMPEQACGQRIAQLTQRLSQLDARRQELAIDEDDVIEPLSDDDLRALQAQVRDVVANGDPPQRQDAPPSADPGSPRGQPGRDLPVLHFAPGSTTVRVSAPGKNRTCARGLGNRCSIH